MPVFITYASYSSEAVQAMVANPQDRTGPVSALLEKAGGKLISFYVTTGSNDVVVISEVPDGTDAVEIGMAVASTGAVSKIETVRAWSAEEFVSVAAKAATLTGVYTPPTG